MKKRTRGGRERRGEFSVTPLFFPRCSLFLLFYLTKKCLDTQSAGEMGERVEGGGGDVVLFSHAQETGNVHNEMGDWTLWEDIGELEGGGGEKAQSRKIRNRRCTVAGEERRRRQKSSPPFPKSGKTFQTPPLQEEKNDEARGAIAKSKCNFLVSGRRERALARWSFMASESGEEEAVASRPAVPVYLVRTCVASSGSRKEFSVFSRPSRL